jgi:hypothetical protein
MACSIDENVAIAHVNATATNAAAPYCAVFHG